MWSVGIEADTITVTDHTSAQRSLPLSELSGVVIETDSSGPLATDLLWLLFGSDDKVALVFPQDAEGQQAAVDRLMALPGFDHEAMIRAMGSTEEAVFRLWRRAAS